MLYIGRKTEATRQQVKIDIYKHRSKPLQVRLPFVYKLSFEEVLVCVSNEFLRLRASNLHLTLERFWTSLFSDGMEAFAMSHHSPLIVIGTAHLVAPVSNSPVGIISFPLSS